MKEFCPGCQSKIEETATHIVWDCPGWQRDRINADTKVEITSSERSGWGANGFHHMLGTCDESEKEKRYVWLALFFKSVEPKRRARLGPFQLQNSRRGRPFTDGQGN
ncbi:MAG: uncharacterized protein A8A55_2286 [Amphiamblys sp. WSBS2006]|nr:MAG: uncharacterized protein A8A55_2286 [Amphiamblys sp. WSBS2006]